MKYKLVVKTEAVQDMAGAFEWYENKKTGLGTAFLEEVNEYFNQIIHNPQQSQSYKNQRIAIMRRFPYKIVYEIESETIVIYAVYHDRRNPEKLTERE